MARPKSERPMQRLNLDLPETIDRLVDDLSYKTDCDSQTEFIRKSVLAYDYYLSMIDKGYKFIAFDDELTEIPMPEIDYKEERKRFNLNISVTFYNIILRLRDRRKKESKKIVSYSSVVSESVALFNSMYKYLSQDIGIGYMKGEEKFKVLFV